MFRSHTKDFDLISLGSNRDITSFSKFPRWFYYAARAEKHRWCPGNAQHEPAQGMLAFVCYHCLGDGDVDPGFLEDCPPRRPTSVQKHTSRHWLPTPSLGTLQQYRRPVPPWPINSASLVWDPGISVFPINYSANILCMIWFYLLIITDL